MKPGAAIALMILGLAAAGLGAYALLALSAGMH